MLIVNCHTNEKIDISLVEFKKQFIKQIQVAIDSYINIQNTKHLYYSKNNSYESDFFFDLQWNFNNLSNSAWYIERM